MKKLLLSLSVFTVPVSGVTLDFKKELEHFDKTVQASVLNPNTLNNTLRRAGWYAAYYTIFTTSGFYGTKILYNGLQNIIEKKQKDAELEKTHRKNGITEKTLSSLNKWDHYQLVIGSTGIFLSIMGLCLSEKVLDFFAPNTKSNS